MPHSKLRERVHNVSLAVKTKRPKLAQASIKKSLAMLGLAVLIGLACFLLGEKRAQSPQPAHIVSQTATTPSHAAGTHSKLSLPTPTQTAHGQFTLYGTITALSGATMSIQTTGTRLDGLSLSPALQIIDPTHTVKTIRDLKVGQAVRVFVVVQQDNLLRVERVTLQTAQ